MKIRTFNFLLYEDTEYLTINLEKFINRNKVFKYYCVQDTLQIQKKFQGIYEFNFFAKEIFIFKTNSVMKASNEATLLEVTISFFSIYKWLQIIISFLMTIAGLFILYPNSIDVPFWAGLFFIAIPCYRIYESVSTSIEIIDKFLEAENLRYINVDHFDQR